MKVVVNEPEVIYKPLRWPIELPEISFYDLIYSIENGTVLFCPPSTSIHKIFINKPIRKLSNLRGKLSKQTKKDIDDQISKLRKEWDRNI